MVKFNLGAFESARKKVFGLGKAMANAPAGLAKQMIKTAESLIPKKKKKTPDYGARIASNIKSYNKRLKDELEKE